MMKHASKQRPRKDEREMAIEKEARSYALEGMIVATQILTLICVLKHNPAWKAGLAVIFFAVAGKLWAMGEAYEERAYQKASLVAGGIGGWFMWRFAKRKKRV